MMPPNGVLFEKSVVSEKNHDMNVSGVMQHSVILLPSLHIEQKNYLEALLLNNELN